MELAVEILVGLAIVVGLFGIVINILPGSVLIAAAVLVWALFAESRVGWWTFAVVAVLVIVGMVANKVIMARHTQKAGTANSSLLIAAIAGVVGFFVVPLVGLVIGFVLGLWVAEYWRLRNVHGAWASAKAGLKGTGWGLLAELGAALVAGTVWLIAAIYT